MLLALCLGVNLPTRTVVDSVNTLNTVCLGWRLARDTNIRRENPDSDIVIAAQNDAKVTREQARSAGANGFVTKSDLIRYLLREMGRQWKTIAAWARQKMQRPTVSPG